MENFLRIFEQLVFFSIYLDELFNPEIMDKLLELVLLIVLALGSALLFSFAMIWKFLQAIFHLMVSAFKHPDGGPY